VEFTSLTDLQLFRHSTRSPARDADGREVGAVRGVLASILSMINGGATHLGVATDPSSVVPEPDVGRVRRATASNDLWASSAARGSAHRARRHRVAHDRVRGRRRPRGGRRDRGAEPRSGPRADLHTDKDLAQCVQHPGGAGHPQDENDQGRNGRDRKFGVRPESIPDYLALVGMPRISRPAGLDAVLSRSPEISPPRSDSGRRTTWGVNAAWAGALGRTLVRTRSRDAVRDLATLRTDTHPAVRLD
jgi:hypothetical protein